MLPCGDQTFLPPTSNGSRAITRTLGPLHSRRGSRAPWALTPARFGVANHHTVAKTGKVSRGYESKIDEAAHMLITRFALFFSIAILIDGQAVDQRDRDFWNTKFSDPGTQFSRGPSRLLAEAIRGRPPGQALDLGMGEGRNTIFLAQRGWQTTGVDLSDVAVAQASDRAAKIHVNIFAVIDDLDHYQLGKNKWDLIALFYMHAWYQGTRPASPQRLIAALKPGGLLVMEGFAGHEKFVFQPNELLRDFAGLEVLRYEDTDAEAEWAPGHQSHIIRFVAEKPK
jgi:SAM-dependent methyltransferase